LNWFIRLAVSPASLYEVWSRQLEFVSLRTKHQLTYWGYRVLNLARTFRWALKEETRSAMIESVIYRPKNMRHLFLNDERLNTFLTKKSHSHALCAALRTSMNAYMKSLTIIAGYRTYNVSMSPKDGGRGTRYFYGLKDLATPFKNDIVSGNDVIIMCDVDYYTDVNRWMQFFRPILMYTMVTNTVTGRGVDYSFHFDGNEVEFHVAGGSSYKHKLWDYRGDTVSTIDRNGTLLVFNIEQRNIPYDEHHRFVVLTPLAAVPYPYYIGLPEIQPIKRLSIDSTVKTHSGVDAKINLMFEPIKDVVSVSREGSCHSVEVPGRVYESIKERIKHKESMPVVSDVERLLKQNDVKTYSTDAPLLFELVTANLKPNRVITNGTVCSYQVDGPLATEDGKKSGVAFATPVVSQPALFPNKGVNADVATIKGRIDKPRNDHMPAAGPMYDWAAEFVSHIVGDQEGKGVPISVEDVRKLQNKPMQRARYAKVAGTMSMKSENRITSFMKSEAYGNASDPRNISTMSPENTTMLSRFTNPFKEDCLKKIQWYGPGLTPTKTIARLGQLARESEEFLCVDYTRLDGSVSQFLQKYVMMAAYMKWCSEEEKPELQNLLNQVFKQSAVTANGIPYKPGYGTRSGSAVTTDGNTMICGFVVFVAYRRMGLNPQEAFNKIGLVYGDDGAFPADEGLADHIQMVADELRLKVKLIGVAKCEPIPYLGRYFIDPDITKNSFQDPIRTLSKIHLTSNKTVTPMQAAANKALGYLATDAKTPLIGTWAKTVIKITGINKAKGLTSEEQYKMSNAWPQIDEQLIREKVSQLLNISIDELDKMEKMIAETKALEDFPVVLQTFREIKIPVVIDGELMEGEMTGPHQNAKIIKTSKDGQISQPAASDSKLSSLAQQRRSRRKNGRVSAQRQAAALSAQVRETGTGIGCSGSKSTGSNPGNVDEQPIPDG